MEDPREAGAPEASAPEVSAVEAISLLQGNMRMVDVREQHEWDAGHAHGAQLIPLSELRERHAELPTGRFLVICHSGGRSLRATNYLLAEGFDAVNVSGGTLAWQAADGQIEAEGPDAARV